MKKLIILLSLLFVTNVWAADTKLSALPELAATPAADDQFYFNDISGTSKKIQYSNLMSGTAAKATASADNPDNCTAGSYPLGVDANWDVESCTDATTEIDSVVLTHKNTAIAHHTATVAGDLDHGGINGLGDDDHSAYENELNNSAGLRAALDDETGGTGVAVFNINPTLTGALLAGILADNDDMIFEIDADDNGDNSYIWTDGASTTIATLDEAGAYQIADDMIVSGGDITFGSITARIGDGNTVSVTLPSIVDVEGYMSIGNGSALNASHTLIIDRDFTDSGNKNVVQVIIGGDITKNTFAPGLNMGFLQVGTDGVEGPSAGITIDGVAPPIVSTLALYEPNITGAGAIVAATLYIKDAPTEGSSNYAIRVGAGAVKFEETLEVVGAITGSNLSGTNTGDQTLIGTRTMIVEHRNTGETFANALFESVASTITRITCYTNTGTSDINFTDGGNDVLSSDLVCSVSGQSACAAGCDVDTINLSFDNLEAFTPDDLVIVVSTVGTTSTIHVTVTVD